MLKQIAPGASRTGWAFEQTITYKLPGYIWAPACPSLCRESGLGGPERKFLSGLTETESQGLLRSPPSLLQFSCSSKGYSRALPPPSSSSVLQRG